MIAGLLAEAMNSLASGINAAAAVISNDLLPASQQASDGAQHELRRVRTISIASGIVVFLLSTLVSAVSGNLLEITYKLVNLLTAPLFSLFFMAIFVGRATGRGAVIGAIVGVGVGAAALSLGANVEAAIGGASNEVNACNNADTPAAGPYDPDAECVAAAATP